MLNVELICEKCGVAFKGGRSESELRHAAKEAGWIRQPSSLALPALHGDKGDFCPECIAQSAMSLWGDADVVGTGYVKS